MGTIQQILSALTALVMALSAQISSLPPSSQLAQVSGSQTPVFVSARNGSNYLNGSGSVNAAALNVISGNALVVGCGSGDVGSGSVNVTDTAGNTFIQAASKQHTDFHNGSWIFYALNTIGNTNDIVSCNFTTSSGSPGDSFAIVLQFSGIANSSALGTTATGEAGGTSVTSDSFNIAQAPEVAIACATARGSSSGIFSAGSGYTIPTNGSVNGADARSFACEYNIFSGNQTNTNASISINTPSVILDLTLETLKGATSGGDTPPPPPTGDTNPPSTPTNLSSTAISSTQINLSWNVSTDNVGVAGYKIYRNSSQITTVTGTSYSDTGLTASTQYTYYVQAYDAAGNNSLNSSSLTVTTQAESVTQPPPEPPFVSSVENIGYNPNYAGTGNGCKVGGTCYYIDYENGSDSNNGLSKSTPWKTAPGMACATGNSATHQFSQTDEFILKGGVIWPYSCYPWVINGGSASTPNNYAYPGMYVGYDYSWNKGIVNSIRVTDPGACSAGTALSVTLTGGGGSGAAGSPRIEVDPYAAGDLQFVAVTNSGSGYTSNPTVSFAITGGSCSKLPTAYADIYSPVMDGSGTVYGNSSSVPQMLRFSPNYGTLDHIEFKHYLWYAGNTYTGGSPNLIYSSGNNQELRNLFVHDFGMNGMANASNLVGARNAAQTSGIYGSGAGTGSILTNSIFNNYESEARGCDNGGLAVSCVQNTAIFDMPKVTNSIINSWRAGVYTTANAASGYLVAGNKVWAILADAATQHPDAFYFMGGTIAYNNILRDIWSGTAAFYVETSDGTTPTAKGMTSYLFNNVMFGKGTRGAGTATPPIGWTSEFVSATASSFNPTPDLRAYNNTFYSNNGYISCMNAGQWFGASPNLSASFPFTIKNNHCVSDQSQGHWFGSNSAGNGYGVWNGLTGPNTAVTQAIIDPTAIVQSPTVANGQGYSESNNYAPTSASNSTVMFANSSGTTNLTNLCSTSVGGISLSPLCKDINGNPRPTTGGWQAGAYQNGSAPASDTSPPSIPANLSASILGTQVNLSWTVSTDNVGVTGYRVERCQGTSCSNFSQIGTPSTASYSDTSLSANTAYRYRVRATDGSGNLSDYSSIVSATTQSALPQISNLVGSNTTSNSTQISWSTNIATNGQVFYGTTASYGLSSSLIDNSTKTTSHSITLSNLSPSTLYHFRVTSIDANNSSTSSPDFTFTTLAASSGNGSTGGTTGGSTGGGAGSGGGSSSSGGTTVYIPAVTTNTTSSGGISTTTCTQINSPSTGSGQAKLTRNLYKSLKGDDVKILQNFLISQNLLSSDLNTGFFGPLTEKAVQSFQKSKNIVSSGNFWSTGYGMVGPTTRAKINSMLSSTSCSMGTPTTQSLQEQIKILQAQVNALLLKLQKAQ